ncbi:MAG TPA: NAD(P) transhydrogenase subunit alpha [Rhizomicrobium sp.]
MVFRLTIFVLAIFVGYFVVWSVTPALHTPLMSVTNAISSVIVVGALIAVSVPTIPKILHPVVETTSRGSLYIDHQYAGEIPKSDPNVVQMIGVKQVSGPQNLASAWTSKSLGLFALVLASVNIFGGFLVTARMLAMYKKKEK